MRPLLFAVLASLAVAGCGTASPASESSGERADAATSPEEGSPVEDAPPITTSPNAWGPTYCAAAGEPGFAVGDQIGDLPVKDCDTGATVSIEEACGAKATWIFAAHTHCPTCRATADFTAEVAASVADQNVAVLHIVHDDSGISCPTWRERYKLAGLPNVKIYADPSGAAWSALKTSNYTAPSAFLDARRVITYKAHGLTQSGIQSKIKDALAR